VTPEPRELPSWGDEEGRKGGECPLSNVVVVEEAPSLFLLTLRVIDLKKG
jgi:hypothetical protein